MEETTYPWQNTSLQDLPGEIWKPIDGYRDCYEVSNFWRVKSLQREARTRGGAMRAVPERILKPRKSCSDSFRQRITVRVNLYNEGIMTSPEVSRLVAFAFIPTSSSNYVPAVKHKDKDYCNLDALNLTWGRCGRYYVAGSFI